jgi:polysaccharide export outer membrane protein
MSGDFAVDETGGVVLPRLGPMKVTDDSPESLKARLVKAYSAFLNHSSIDVTLLRRLQVLGAVRNPGLYPVDATMTVADALALAGGTTPQGHPDRVELVRNGERLEARLSRNTQLTGTQIRSGDQIFVPERSWISRNTGVVTAGITASVSIIVALLTVYY